MRPEAVGASIDATQRSIRSWAFSHCSALWRDCQVVRNMECGMAKSYIPPKCLDVVDFLFIHFRTRIPGSSDVYRNTSKERDGKVPPVLSEVAFELLSDQMPFFNA